MAACPNCGRQTQRTKDWACQWCGYPLVSRAYKKIDKTFKELQEERNLTLRSTQPEGEPEFEPESEPEREPEPEPRPRPPARPVSKPAPKPEPTPQPKPKQEPEAAPEPVQQLSPPKQTATPPRPEPVAKSPEPQPEPATKQPVIQLPPPGPKPAPPPQPVSQTEEAPEPEPLITPPPEPKKELPPATKPEIKIEPEPAPAAAIKLDKIQDGMEITADQIDALFKADKAGAHSKFTEKTLVIKGIVGRVFVREHLEIRYIVLTGTNKRIVWSLRCTFNKEDSSKLTRLTEGQEVTVRGKYDGFSKNIIFKECTLV